MEMNLGQHTLRSYDSQLEHLMQLILDMGREVGTLVTAAKTSFRSRDLGQVSEAKAHDKHINALDHQIEEAATVVLALQNPMAVDLRYVISVLKITGMLERAGDLAKNTVKRSSKMGEFDDEAVVAQLEKMADIVLEMLNEALDAFRAKDNARAIAVWKRDEEIDTLYHDIFTQMQKQMVENPKSVIACTHLVFAAKNLERLADYTTNIAKTVYYVTSGKRADKGLLKQAEGPENTEAPQS
ncbi:MAG: phosphate signaling complex protein PhoU [Rickettsiales bacterium]|nr:phosphate signaling complex protein PhoU [Rickettsiales bacterium]